MDSSNQQLHIAAIQEVYRQFDQDYFRPLVHLTLRRIAMVRDALTKDLRVSAEVLPVLSCKLINVLSCHT